MTQYLEYPALLALVIILPVVVVGLITVAYRRRRARLARLGAADLVARLVPPVALRTARWRLLVLGLAAACAGVAFAGPRWGTEQTVVRGEGIDLVLALDASLSMMATDERPNRLTRMKQEVRQLIALSRGDRVGLIAFAGRSYILTPLTIDEGAIDLYLDNLDPSVVGQAGSSLARAIRQGVALLRTARGESDRALVVMSDGEAFEPVEDVMEAARLAREAGITLVTVGFGSRDGARIPSPEAGDEGFKRDESGNIVVSRYNPDYLRGAAEAAGGTFIAADESDKAARVRRALSTLRTQSRAAAAGRERRARYQWFLLPAVLLVLLDTIAAERRGRRRPAPPAALPAQAAALLLLVGGMVGCIGRDDAARAASAYREGRPAVAASLYARAIARGDERPAVFYNYGTALLGADSLARAAEVLQPLATHRDDELRYRAVFNQGLAQLRRGRGIPGDTAREALDAALEAYKTALLMRPRVLDAKWNYELALRAEQSGGGGGGGGADDAESEAPDPTPDRPAEAPRPAGGLGQQRAEQLLNSAARDEREVQSRRQKQNRPTPPPGGRDW